MSTKHSRWYVIQCRPHQERRALENLRRQGFTCYLPTIGIEKLRHGCKRETQEPLFPGYLFISLNEVSDNWHPVRSTRGVMQIVRFDEYPVPLRDEIIEAIRGRLASSQPRIPYLQPGERVRIAKGPFSDIEAIFIANDGTERVVLLMNILQREQTLSFPVASVRKKTATWCA